MEVRPTAVNKVMILDNWDVEFLETFLMFMNELLVGWDCRLSSEYFTKTRIRNLYFVLETTRCVSFFPSVPFLNRSRSLCTIDWRRHVPGTHASTYSYHSPSRKRIFTSCTVVYSIWSYFLLLLLDIAASERWLDGMWRVTTPQEIVERMLDLVKDDTTTRTGSISTAAIQEDEWK